MDDHDLRYEAVDEDEVSCDELRRQILLLTAEDDEDVFESGCRNSVGNCRQRSMATAVQPAGSYFSCCEAQSKNLALPWLANLWRNGNGGTGVFIPHIGKSRRRQKIKFVPTLVKNPKRFCAYFSEESAGNLNTRLNNSDIVMT